MRSKEKHAQPLDGERAPAAPRQEAKRKLALSGLSLVVWVVVLLAATATWFVRNQAPKVDSLFFQPPDGVTALFSTWYKPFSQMEADGSVNTNMPFRLATNPLAPGSGGSVQDTYGPENTEGQDAHAGTFGHELKYIRPGDAFRFHVRVSRSAGERRTLALQFENIRQVSYLYDSEGNAVDIDADPYDDPNDPVDLSCLFSVQVLAVTPGDSQTADANADVAANAYYAPGAVTYLSNQADGVLRLPLDSMETAAVWAAEAADTLDIWIEIKFLDARANIPTGTGQTVTRTANDYQNCALRIDRLLLLTEKQEAQE